MELNPENLSWVGSILSDCGALLLCLNMRHSNWGFVVFLVGNIFWVISSVQTGNMAVTTNQLFLMGTSAIGIWRWIISRPQIIK